MSESYMLDMRRSGLVPTKLDKFLLKEFTTLLQGKIGHAFLIPTSDSHVYKMNFLPYTFVDSPVFWVEVDKNVNIGNPRRPIFIRAKGNVQKKLSYDSYDRYFLFEDILEEISYENLLTYRDRIFLYENKDLDIKGLPIAWNYFRAQFLEDIQCKSSNSLAKDLYETVLDGIEVAGIEDLLPLLLVSSPQYNKYPGGFDSALIGKRLSTLAMRLRRLSSDRTFEKMEAWKYLSVNGVKLKEDTYTLVKTQHCLEHALSLNYAKYSIEEFNKSQPDYPIMILRAPEIEDERNNSRLYEDQDIYDFITYMRFSTPVLPPELDITIKKRSNLIYNELLSMGKRVSDDQDISTLNKPWFIKRVYQAVSRIDTTNSLSVDTKTILADKLIQNANEILMETLNVEPTTVATKPFLAENVVLKKIIELKSIYPTGIPKSVIRHAFEQWKNDLFERIIRNLTDNGHIYSIERPIGKGKIERYYFT